MAVIGVDLGTTNSLCCVWNGGKCVLIPNSLGDCLTPSVVSVDDNGDILTGRIAKERRITHPNHTAASFKQFMGTDKIYQLGAMRFRPEELSSLILRRLKEDAEVFLGEKVTEAVISVPAYFNNNQRTMTKLAGELAGLRVERIINEPSAAALAYRQQSDTGGVYLVVDFGGGTLDISVVDIFENIVDIIAVAGDNHLGGDNIDEAIAEAFYDRHPALQEQLSDSEKASVRKMAEQCKINLTSAEQAMMLFVHGGQTYDLLLTNQTLADVCAPILAKIRSLLLRVLKDSGRHIGLIDDIILVGGSGKMPVVQTYLAHVTGKLPRCGIDPDKAIALGVGIVTGIKARDEQIRDVIMTDICPFTLGTRVYNPLTKDRNEYSPVIERNTSLPVSRVQIYASISDYQTTMGLDIYQGESSSVLNNIWLGKLDMPIPPAPAGQAQVTLRFTYDINGILEVEATSLQSGETRKKLIVTNKDLSGNEISELLDVLQQLKIPPRELDRNRLLLERGARLYEESTGDQREMVRNEMTLFEISLELTHPAEKEMARSRFLQFLDLSDHFDEELYLRGDI